MLNIAYYRGNFKRILITGPDSWDFMNRISTRQFTEENLNQSLPCAFLSGKSEVVSLFQAVCKSNAVELFVEPQFFQKTQTHIESLHFAENFQVQIQENLIWVELRSENNSLAKSTIVAEEDFGGKKVLIVPLDNWGVPGILLGANEAEDILKTLQSLQIKTIDEDDYRQLRAFCALPVETDLISGSPILELGLERYVDRDKGCYPGQEVVEKTFTYGKPARKLIQFVITSGELHSGAPHILRLGEEMVGVWSKMYRHQNKSFGLGLVRRTAAEVGTVLSLDGVNIQAQVQKLT